MVKPTYFRVFTPLVVIAAGAVLAMVLLLLGAAKPSLADAGWAPTIDYPANNSEFADGNVYFEGYGPPGGSVDLFEVKDEGNNKVGYSQVSECQYLGTPLYNQYCWSVSLTGVADGTHTYYAVAYDENGNASDPSNSVTVVVDRSIPPTVNNIFNPSYDGQTTTGPVAWIGADFSKTMDPNTLTNSTFTLVKHESDGSTTPVDGTVSWSIYGAEHRFAHLGFPSYLEGNTKYTATIKGGPEGVKDEFGIPLAEDYVWSFTTAAWPTVTSVSPSDGVTQVPTNENITATFSKDMKWYWLMWPKTGCTGCIQRFTLVKEGSTTPVDATVVYGAGSTATLDPTVNLQENTKYTATVKGQPDGVEDVWSNPLAEDKIWSFTTGDATPPEDVSPPETIIDSGPSGPTSDSTPTFTFSGSDDVTTTANLKYQYRLDGGPWSTPASTSTTANLTSLSDGAHLFEVRAVDEAANEDGSPAQQSFTVDTSVPETTITSGPSGALSSTTASFDFSSNESNATFECKLDNGASESCTSPKEYNALSDGSHTFSVKAADTAGNTDSSPASRTWTVDTTPPTVSSVMPTEGKTEVAITTSVVASFSEEMDATSVTAPANFALRKEGGTATVVATLSYEAFSKKATLTPSAPLDVASTYRVTVSGAKDLAANQIDQDPNTSGNQPKEWSFTTAAAAPPPDTSSPTVQSTSPSDGAKQVPRETTITAQFSEEVDGVTEETFMLGKGQISASQLTSATKIASGTSVSYETASRTATLDPYGSSSIATLARCQWYTARVTRGVEDKAGNSALEKVWAFKTRGC